MVDGQTVQKAIESLKNFTSNENYENFFLGVGFVLPHQQMFVPQRFFDMYPLEDILPVGKALPPVNTTFFDYRSGGW